MISATQNKSRKGISMSNVELNQIGKRKKAKKKIGKNGHVIEKNIN